MYVKAPIPSEVYHLTKKANLESILDDGAIRRFDDTECWFCSFLPVFFARRIAWALRCPLPLSFC